MHDIETDHDEVPFATIDGLVRGFVIALLPALALWCALYAAWHLL